MNSSTSCCWTSRKYSAMVNADSATRSRVPGGSSICPKTNAVSLMTLDSVISMSRSLPSRVRSPTPANTDTPPKFLATRVIISWMSTVLPTPAPPNRPILPPFTYGVSRSMTLMPVSRISVLGSSGLVERRRGRGGSGHRSATCSDAVGTSSVSPSTLNTCPLVTSPTRRTEMASPVSVTVTPRTMPSVCCMEIARTTLSPMCWATSRVSVLVTPSRVTSTCSAL